MIDSLQNSRDSSSLQDSFKEFIKKVADAPNIDAVQCAMEYRFIHKLSPLQSGSKPYEKEYHVWTIPNIGSETPNAKTSAVQALWNRNLLHIPDMISNNRFNFCTVTMTACSKDGSFLFKKTHRFSMNDSNLA